MNAKKFFLTAAASLALVVGVAGMASAQGGPHHGGYSHSQSMRHADRHGGEHHDRYWRSGYRGYASHARFHRTLRGHGYHRWDGDPYWYRGHYVVRTYDRRGRMIFVELNPYTADFVGIIRF